MSNRIFHCPLSDNSHGMIAQKNANMAKSFDELVRRTTKKETRKLSDRRVHVLLNAMSISELRILDVPIKPFALRSKKPKRGG